MANATITTSSSIAPGTVANLANAFSTALQNAGFTEVGAASSSGDEFRYLEYEYDVGVTYGKFVVEIGVFDNGAAAHYLQVRAGSDITGGTTLNNPSTSIKQPNQDNNANAWLGQTFTFTEIVHPECRGVICYQTSGFAIAALFFRPATTPTWADENAYPLAFVKRDLLETTHTYGAQSSLRPGGTSDAMLINTGNCSGLGANPSDLSRRLVLSESVISNNNGAGSLNSVAAFSSDIAAIASDGMTFLDTITSGLNEWTLIEAGSSTELRIAVRTGA